MAVPGELEYYRARSGLAAGTLADHKLAYFRLQLPTLVGTVQDLETAFYRSKLGVVGTLASCRLAYFAGKSGLASGDVSSHMAKVFAAGGPEPPGGGDVTNPTAGTLAASSITQTTFTLTVSGAADETALHASPYAFSTDNGSSWSAYQSSPIFPVTGKVASTGYTCVHRTRDAAGNVAVGSSILVTTSAPSGALVGAYTDKGADAADLTTYTFAARAIGAASADRRVVVAISTNSTRAVSAVTIGGITASVHYTQAIGGTARMAVASAVVPTGTTADVVVTLDGAGLGMGIGVWALTGTTSAFNAGLHSGGDGASTSIATAAGDFVIGYAFGTGVAAAGFAWNVGTERFDEQVYSTTTWHSGMDLVAAGSSVDANANISPDAATVMTVVAGFRASAVVPLVTTFLQGAGSGTDAGTYTFPAQNLGAAHAERRIVVAASGRQSAARDVNSVSVAGVAATKLVSVVAGQNPLNLWMAHVPAGTTGDIVIVFNGAMLRAQYVAWSVVGALSVADFEAGTDSATITGVANGIVIAASNNVGSSFTWTNATERYDATVETSLATSGADATAVGSTLITATAAVPSAQQFVAVALAP